jgi:hypothetical protein
MKLYTEEQVIKAALFSLAEDATMEKIFDLLTPIELPSDEDIMEQTKDFMFENNKEIFFNGAKWMRDKILNK